MEYCIYKSQSENNVFQPSESLYFTEIFSGPTMVGLIVGSGYEKTSNTLYVNSAYKISKMALLFAKRN